MPTRSRSRRSAALATSQVPCVSLGHAGWLRYASRNSSSRVGGALVSAVTPAWVRRWSTSGSASGSTVQANVWSSTERSWTPARRVEALGDAGDGRGDPAPPQVPQLVEGAGLDRPALADDRDPVGQPLDLAEDVAGQQHRRARGHPLRHAVVEDLLHQRVQPGRRLVEHQQVHVGGERRHQRDLLPVALRVRPALLGRVQVEPLQQLLAVTGAGVRTAHAQQHVDGLAAGQVRPQRHVAGHVREPAVDGHRVPPRVLAEHRRRTVVDPRAARAARGSWSTCRRRSGPGSRAPLRPGPRGRARPARDAVRTS